MKTFQVIRTHLSPYHNDDFLYIEKQLVESFPELKHVELNQFQEMPTILLTNTHTKLKILPEKLIKNSKLIIHANSGYDHFIEDFELWKNIPVVIGHSIRAQAVAEYCLAALFQGAVELPQHLKWDNQRKWERRLLKGTSVWIFGHGHIGKIISCALSALGLKITVIDPFIKECPHQLLSRWQEGDIKEARIIISTMSLNPTSRQLLNKEFFNHLGQEVILINAARGQLIDEVALKNYLSHNPSSIAFLDVFEKEPFDQNWIGIPQIWKTSHIAGVEKNLDQKIFDFEKQVLHDFLYHQDDFLSKYQNELLQNKRIDGVII